MHAPVFVYYKVHRMWQNHLVYYFSNSINQLHGDATTNAESDCRYVHADFLICERLTTPLIRESVSPRSDSTSTRASTDHVLR